MPCADISDAVYNAPRNCWLALNEEQSKVLGYGDTPDEAIDAARKNGEDEPVLIWAPSEWIPSVY